MSLILSVLMVVALGLGVAGLIVGISAKNGNTSDEELSRSIRGQLGPQVTKLRKSLAAARSAGARTAAEAGKAERKGRQVQAEEEKTQAAEKRTAGQLGTLSDRVTRQQQTIGDLRDSQETLRTRLDRLSQQLSELRRKKG